MVVLWKVIGARQGHRFAFPLHVLEPETEAFWDGYYTYNAYLGRIDPPSLWFFGFVVCFSRGTLGVLIYLNSRDMKSIVSYKHIRPGTVR